MPALTLITPPAVEPVSLAEAKKHVETDHNEDDTYIQGLLKAARLHLEGANGFLGRALVTQTWQLTLDAFSGCIRVPLPPLQSVESIKYDDAEGAEQTLDPADYIVDAASEPARLLPVQAWPPTINRINAVRVRFVAGWPTTGSPPQPTTPDPLRHAILLLVGHWYANREEVVVGTIATTVPRAVNALANPFRVTWL